VTLPVLSAPGPPFYHAPLRVIAMTVKDHVQRFTGLFAVVFAMKRLRMTLEIG
jgi:hypothetical protein